MGAQFILAGLTAALSGAALIFTVVQPAPTESPDFLNPAHCPTTPVAYRAPAGQFNQPQPGVYVTHPYVIAVLVPGQVDPGMNRFGSAADLPADTVVNPPLQFDPIK